MMGLGVSRAACSPYRHRGWPVGVVQEKQIRARAGMKQLRDNMRNRRLKVADRVSKHMLFNVRFFPKVCT